MAGPLSSPSPQDRGELGELGSPSAASNPIPIGSHESHLNSPFDANPASQGNETTFQPGYSASPMFGSHAYMLGPSRASWRQPETGAQTPTVLTPSYEDPLEAAERGAAAAVSPTELSSGPSLEQPLLGTSPAETPASSLASALSGFLRPKAKDRTSSGPPPVLDLSQAALTPASTDQVPLGTAASATAAVEPAQPPAEPSAGSLGDASHPLLPPGQPANPPVKPAASAAGQGSKAVAIGLINAAAGVPSLVAFAAIVFQDPVYESKLDLLCKFFFISSALHQLIFCAFSTLPFAIGQVQDVGLIFLSAMATSIAGMCLQAGFNEAEALGTSLVAMSLSTLIVGVMTLLVAKFHFASVVQYVPLPVIGGYLGFVGYFCIAAGSALATSVSIDGFADWTKVLTVPGLEKMACMAAACAAMMVTAERAKNPLALPGVLALIVVLFHFARLALGLTLEDCMASGWVLRPAPGRQYFWQLWDLFNIRDLQLSGVYWTAIFGQVGKLFGLILVVCFGSCMDIAAIQQDYPKKLDFDRELTTVGLSNVITSLVGCGYPGSYIFSQTIFTMRAGVTSRINGLVVAGIELTVFLLPFSVVQYMPNFFFGALLVWFGIEISRDWLVHSYHTLTRIEYGLLWLTFAAVTKWGLEGGIFAGIVLATLYFAYAYAKSQVAAVGVTQSASNVIRTSDQQRALALFQNHLSTAYLNGFVFFGTAHTISTKLEGIVDELIKPKQPPAGWTGSLSSRALAYGFGGLYAPSADAPSATFGSAVDLSGAEVDLGPPGRPRGSVGGSTVGTPGGDASHGRGGKPPSGPSSRAPPRRPSQAASVAVSAGVSVAGSGAATPRSPRLTADEAGERAGSADATPSKSVTPKRASSLGRGASGLLPSLAASLAGPSFVTALRQKQAAELEPPPPPPRGSPLALALAARAATASAPRFLILDFTTVRGVDATAARALGGLVRALGPRGVAAVLTAAPPDTLDLLEAHGVEVVSCRWPPAAGTSLPPPVHANPVPVFSTLAEGLRYAEDTLLAVAIQHGLCAAPSARHELQDLLALHLGALPSAAEPSEARAIARTLEGQLERVHLAPGETLWVLGEDARNFFIINQGTLHVDQFDSDRDDDDGEPEAGADKVDGAQEEAGSPEVGGLVQAGAPGGPAPSSPASAVRAYELGPGCVAGVTDFFLTRSHLTSARAGPGGASLLRASRACLKALANRAPRELAVLQTLVMRANTLDLTLAARHSAGNATRRA